MTLDIGKQETFPTGNDTKIKVDDPRFIKNNTFLIPTLYHPYIWSISCLVFSPDQPPFHNQNFQWPFQWRRSQMTFSMTFFNDGEAKWPFSMTFFNDGAAKWPFQWQYFIISLTLLFKCTLGTPHANDQFFFHSKMYVNTTFVKCVILLLFSRYQNGTHSVW